ncbi:MAG: serine/threonine-protein kinase, partial [Pseudomonadota bacterium]
MNGIEPGQSLLEPDSMVDHYRVLRLIGSGGMGEVYLARDTKLGRRVALKVIRPSYATSTAMIERFLREAQITATFSHPNIITVYAVGEYQGTPYLALEYVEGQTLRQRMQSERPSVREAMRIGLATARALAEAHRNNIMHRDLKPANILLAKDGRLRVLDLGLAKLITDLACHDDETGSRSQSRPAPQPGRLWHLRPEQDKDGDRDDNHNQDDESELPTNLPTNLPVTDVQQYNVQPDGLAETAPCRMLPDATPSGITIGTPPYTSPEAFRGEPTAPAADIWAFGMIMYELLAGRRPYADCPIDSLPALIGNRTAVQPPTVTELPLELVRLVMRCLNKEPLARPSAEEATSNLEALLRHKSLEKPLEESPFRGLLSFGEQHADFFFGRDSEVAFFLEALRERPVLTVVGPSGAGKSSFVQAGVIPRLREQGSWLVIRARPGSDPFAALALVLQPAARGDGNGNGDGDGDQNDHGVALAPRLREQPRLLNVTLHELADRRRCRVLLFVDQLEE